MVFLLFIVWGFWEKESFSKCIKMVIAGEGFEPPTSGLWAPRALQAALPRSEINTFDRMNLPPN